MRRTRIKGIASIPQRKKDVAVAQKSDDKNTAPKEEESKDGTVKETENIKIESQIGIGKEVTNSDAETSVEVKPKVSILSNIVLSPQVKRSNNEPIITDQGISLGENENSNSSLDELKLTNSIKINEIDFLNMPPSSPNKINRGRIKAVPRLGMRKISFSASESEDELKKGSSRTRNDSQSSNISIAPPIEPISISEAPSTPKVKEFSAVIQKKCKRTEWSRKLAEARREFTRKYVSGKPPEHKKLTMIDLIFYNPTTNIIKKTNKRSDSVSVTEEREDDLDDPAEKEKDDENISECEENDVLAPQIKIGPSGEIVLDEKSLLIESKETKKNRAVLEKSKVLDGNSDDRPYGVFKKAKRSKDWSHSETVKFYRALNVVGTDFSLMCELFPTRTRKELKMKFKKEERVNHLLVDKAMMEPCGFNFDSLKKEFELHEMERKEVEKQKKDCADMKRRKENKATAKFRNVVENSLESTDDELDQIQKKTVRRRYEKKTRKKITSDDEDEDKVPLKRLKNDETSPPQVENPTSDSIVILPSNSPNDGSVQIFMVSEDENGSNNLLKIGTIEARAIESNGQENE